MRITESAFYAIVDHIGTKPAESGGALYGRPDDYTIVRFVPDKHAVVSRSTYQMDTEQINATSEKLWNEEGLLLVGIVHSHPIGHATLSMPDRAYFTKMMTWIERKVFFAPIAFSTADGGFKLFPYVLGPNGDVLGRSRVELIPDDALEPAQEAREVPVEGPASGAAQEASRVEPTSVQEPRWKRLLLRSADAHCVARVVAWEWQVVKVLLIALLAWTAISITPALIAFLTNLFLNR
ncbi:MAG TPA: Mov34/MPN/PAD-1 family protein [Flavobacteriales bacterium]|nr:Mov34/MPN/PAD-1 family protein [Flavobacteriales bacterium]HMR28792.1 Mov34/MPN/PAD-1 family protein [Flavobacteriales bacterium]